ncbi:MAG: BatA domain-containing protein [Ignavibacteriales bacterium]|nr:BatA domain-containing protein [Ignavibacteriales bacterium]
MIFGEGDGVCFLFVEDSVVNHYPSHFSIIFLQSPEPNPSIFDNPTSGFRIMNFLSPGLLFGLLAASIPILIHLLNLRKLKKIDFSTLHFLKLIEKQKVRRVKLIQWLLMALRVLIIAMLVLGFSRPVIQDVRIPGIYFRVKNIGSNCYR